MFCDLHLSVNAFRGRILWFLFVPKLKVSHQKCSAAVREERKNELEEIAPGKIALILGEVLDFLGGLRL